MTTVQQERENRFKNPLLIVGAVCTVIPIITQATTITCEIPSLKWVLIIILLISCTSFCSFIFKNTDALSSFSKWCWMLLCVLGLSFFAIYIYNKKCSPTETAIYDNRKTTYNINKLPQRTLTSEDIAELKEMLPDPKTKVVVQYLQSSAEDTLISQQIISVLTETGHSNVVVSQAVTLPNDLTPGRMTIRRESIEDEIIYKVIINPQQ